MVLSHSKLSTYFHCPCCYHLQYVLGVKSKYEKYNLVFGSLLHALLEHNPKNTIDAMDIIDLELEEVGTIEKRKDGKNIIVSKQQIKSDLMKMAMLAIDTELEFDGKKLGYKEIEKEIYMPYGDHVIRGFLDGISTDEHIIEHKTSSVKYTQDSIKEKHQHVIYEMLYRFQYGKPSNGVLYDVFYKKANPVREIIKVNVTDEDIKRTTKWIDSIVNGIENEIFTPNVINNPHFCDYKELCPYCQNKRLFNYG